jgi:GTP-binding protein
MKIFSADFVKGATEPHQYPPEDLPEIAFGGKSNVGKSSLINDMVGRKSLVKTSKTPGRTREINFFNVNDELYLVDLPGFGYAKVSKSERESWGPMIENYLQYRRNLVAMVCLVDIRRGVQQQDRQLIQAAPHFGLQPIPVFTKADKLSKQKRGQRRREIADELEIEPDELILYSTEERMGRDELWRRIGVLCELPGYT